MIVLTNHITVFDRNTSEYDNWFDKHSAFYQSEILALKQAISNNRKGLEIGVGTGRFAVPLNIKSGVEPSLNMAKVAERRGLEVIRAVAEDLPIEDSTFDFVLMVTTVCFLPDIPKAFSEVHRILKPGGEIVLGIINKDSKLGRKYENDKSKNKFYEYAHFHTPQEITSFLQQANFYDFSFWNTLTETHTDQIEQPKQGIGKGSFVVIKAKKAFHNW